MNTIELRAENMTRIERDIRAAAIRTVERVTAMTADEYMAWIARCNRR